MTDVSEREMTTVTSPSELLFDAQTGVYQILLRDEKETDLLRDKVERAILIWQGRLGLRHWKIRAGDPQDFSNRDQEEAYVYFHRPERAATIYISPETPDHLVERNVVHELLHLVVNEFTVPVKHMGGFQPGQLDYLSEQEEELIGVLTTALLPDVAWEPVYTTDRRRYGFT